MTILLYIISYGVKSKESDSGEILGASEFERTSAVGGGRLVAVAAIAELLAEAVDAAA